MCSTSEEQEDADTFVKIGRTLVPVVVIGKVRHPYPEDEQANRRERNQPMQEDCHRAVGGSFESPRTASHLPGRK